MLICPVCQSAIDPDGPGVGSYPIDDDPSREWKAYWIPFIYDLRGSPRRLVHPECFAAERGVSALVALFHHDDKVRQDQERHRM